MTIRVTNHDCQSYQLHLILLLQLFFPQKFLGAHEFNQHIGNWNVSKVTNMQSMVSSVCDCVQWNGQERVTYCDCQSYQLHLIHCCSNYSAQQFYGASEFNQDIGNWNVSKVTTMYQMVSSVCNCVQWNGQDRVPNHDCQSYLLHSMLCCSNDMAQKFCNAAAFNQDIGNWNLSSVTNMTGMVSHSCVCVQVKWYGRVTNDWLWYLNHHILCCSHYFWYKFRKVGAFNQNIGNWNVSKVTTMAFMVSLLCVVIFGITSLSIMIDSNIYDNICLYKFDGASAFNQYIGNWNVGSVTNMESMVSNSCVCVYLT